MVVRIENSMEFEERVETLCELMKEETEVCRELLELSKSEQKYLMKNDVEKLYGNTDRMKEIIDILKKNQVVRRDFMRDLGREMGIRGENVTISTIGERVPAGLSHKLKKISVDLVKIGERLYRANHNTIYLIDFSLDLLEQQNRLWAEIVSEKDEGYGVESRRTPIAIHPLLIEKKV